MPHPEALENALVPVLVPVQIGAAASFLPRWRTRRRPPGFPPDGHDRTACSCPNPFPDDDESADEGPA